ncbi:hypothetical protein [Micromonospora wenchangensis]|uniref:hypothetical protein n=1 Tax=Micromonospora wenchangensis TaxID=1185415 RepID=UPI00380BBDB7
MSTSASEQALPYSTGTIRDFRARILAQGFAGEKRFNELLNSSDTPLDSEQARDLKLAHYACLYGYATASLLGFIADKFGDDAAAEAAAMVDDMGANGGAPYCEDFPYPPQVQP